MATSTIRSIARRSTATLIRGLGCWTRTYHSDMAANPDKWTERISNKQVKIEATFFVEGLEASEVKTILPLVQRHLNVFQARKAVYKHLESVDLGSTVVRDGYYTKVTLEGYDDCHESDTWLEQYLSVPADAQPKDTKNLKLLFEADIEERHRP